jgi:dienelactone hydrolase
VRGLVLGLVVSTLAAASPAPARAEEAAALDMREQIQRVPVTVKDMFGRQETKPITITIFRPRGDGPFPLAIMNHGRATDAHRAEQGRQRYEDISRYLVSKGFVVLVPTRVGYAETYGDFDPETSGECNARRLEPMAEALFTQVMVTVEFAKTLPFVDASRWIVVGQSVGGFASVVAVGKHPAGLLAGINFAGGTGGDPDNRPQRPCSPQAVERLWRGLAPGATAPMAWFYWQNDQYWGPDIPKQWHAAWVEAGGKAEFHGMAAAGKDGHSGSGIDMDHWVPLVDDFLARLGFTNSSVVARPPPSGFAAIDDVDKVPISAASRDAAYRRFLEAKPPRAFAVGPHGAWGFVSGDWVLGKALGRCERRGETCKLYAVDNDVVWVP